jgi:hypothetical protein
MSLSWKDVVTTVLAGVTGALVFVRLQGWHSWLMSPRWGILVLGILGVVMCAAGASGVRPGSWATGLSVLGALSLVIMALGLITGQVVFFYALAADMLVLWLLATLRHAVMA